MIVALNWPGEKHPSDVRLKRAWAGRNQRLTVEYEVNVKDGESARVGVIQGVQAARVPVLKTVRRKPRFADRWWMGVAVGDPAGSCWLASPDCDPELPALRRLYRTDSVRHLVADPSYHPASEAQSLAAGLDDYEPPELIAYRIGRRFVLRLPKRRDDGPGLYIKGFRRSVSPEALRRADVCGRMLAERSDGRVRVPRRRGVVPRWRLLISEEVNPKAVQTGYGVDDVAAAGKAAALIHALPTEDEARLHTSEDELDTMARWHRVLQMSAPEAAGRLARIVETSQRVMPDTDRSALRTIHRDFYHAQLLRNGTTVWLVDWDTTGLGHPELDIATYLAHGMLARICSTRDAVDDQTLVEVFLDAYRGSGGVCDAKRLQWYLAGAVTRLAAMYTARGYPESVLVSLWECGEEMLRGSSAIVRLMN